MAISAVFVLPLLWEVFRSLQPESAVTNAPSSAGFTHLTWANYTTLLSGQDATTALYAFLFSWTEFLGALSFLTNDSLFTLPVALSNAETGTYGAVNYGLLLAGAVIAMIPCVVVYVSLQRFYVRGLVSGALKG